MGRTSTFLGLAALLVACAGDSLSLPEYGTQAEVLVLAVTQQIDSLDAEVETYSRTEEGTETYWNRRLEARVEFLDGLESLRPPDDAVELHGIVVDLFGRLNAAEEALADRVATMEPGVGPAQWWDTPEGHVANAVDQEVDSICHVAQAEFDKTEVRDVFADTPWIPSDMKEVVRVAFGCSEQPV